MYIQNRGERSNMESIRNLSVRDDNKQQPPQTVPTEHLYA